jgi:lysophospholipase L1-like esterase
MRRFLPAAVLALTLALASGCWAGDADEPEAGPARATGSPTGAPTAYDEYVALGDSYTAAPLVPPTDTSNLCLRSGVNYPALVAEAMPGTTLTDVSCSGAGTRNTTTPQTGRGGSVPPQLDALSRTTDLVTIGLGGNDHALFATLLGRCTQLAVADPDGAPCTAAYPETDTAATLADIRRNVAGVIAAVRDRSPHARIVVVGYPQIVPESGTCDLLPLAAGDYPFARDVNEGLARAVRLAADDAQADYLDLWAPSTGHDICAADPWINGRVTTVNEALAYHPFAVEQAAVADLLLGMLTED